MEPVKELTPEQKKKIEKLYRAASWRGLLLGIRAGGMVVLGNALVIFLNIFLSINSEGFLFIASIINGFFIFRSLGRNIRKEHDTLREEIKKILEN